MAGKKNQKPEVTLMLASSVDGCLVTADSNDLDPNPQWKSTPQVQSIIFQFFEMAQHSERYILISSDVVLKLGINSPAFVPKQSTLSLIVYDAEGQLEVLGLQNLVASVKSLIYCGPAQKWKTAQQKKVPGAHFIVFSRAGALKKLLLEIGSTYDVKTITIQSAGAMNAAWLQAGVVDHLTLIVYPLLVSNNGSSILTTKALFAVQPLQLVSTSIFDQNYVSLQYDVVRRHTKRVQPKT